MLRPAVRAAALGCSSCRSSILKTFTGIAPVAPCRTSNTWKPALRTLSSSTKFLSDELQTLKEQISATSNDSNADVTAPPASASPDSSIETNTEVPWYLQVEPPRHPMLEAQRQPLPEVPVDSPKLIAPLLKFVADDLGLDDLNLLDLRALDPPPALGPNLFMLFGTARSYRHLHVSADRFVRWLRTQGISATADGLLGRNELKIKLRRKARKAKLLGNTSGRMDEDDGITTSWICVNLGTLGQSNSEQALVNSEGHVTGFGSAQSANGTTIVVQMLTESKRQDLDLETLWTNMLERSERRTERETQASLDAPVT